MMSEGDGMSKTRFEAFSDGVFAFAITLLVLGIALQGFEGRPSEPQLVNALLRLWPAVLAYALSFAVIGIMWQNHQTLFHAVERIDRTTVFLNLLLLGATAFIPFVTGVLGTYGATRPGAFVYGLTLTASATFYNLLLWYLQRSGAFAPTLSPETIRQTVIGYRIGWCTYAGATILALFIPVVSYALYLVIAAYYLVPRGIDSDLDHP